MDIEMFKVLCVSVAAANVVLATCLVVYAGWLLHVTTSERKSYYSNNKRERGNANADDGNDCR